MLLPALPCAGIFFVLLFRCCLVWWLWGCCACLLLGGEETSPSNRRRHEHCPGRTICIFFFLEGYVCLLCACCGKGFLLTCLFIGSDKWALRATLPCVVRIRTRLGAGGRLAGGSFLPFICLAGRQWAHLSWSLQSKQAFSGHSVGTVGLRLRGGDASLQSIIPILPYLLLQKEGEEDIFIYYPLCSSLLPSLHMLFLC